MNKSLFIIPFFNEEKRIPHHEFAQAFVDFGEIDFLLVNDGSTDNTQVVLEEFSARYLNVNTLNLKLNQGKAAAIRNGILFSKNFDYQYLGYLDADLSTPISEVVRLLAFAEANPNLAIIMGTRIKLLGNNVVRSSKRHYLGRIFATLISNFILKTPVYDTQCGAKIIKSEIAQFLFAAQFQTRWLFDVEMLLRLKNAKGSLENYVAELPLHTWIEKGNTKIKFKEFVNFPFQLMKIYLKNAR
jgi:dolichyl-phosphate beta-glucosyltransferase